MSPTHDPFALCADQELQLTTLKAGWRFYERAAEREDAQQALTEWVHAVAAVLDLGIDPSVLVHFRDCLATAREVTMDEALQQEIRTLVAAVEPARSSCFRAPHLATP